MYVNGDYRGDNPLGKLMHDFSMTNADEMYYNELASRVRFHKQDEKGVQNMCKIVEEYGDERAAEALKIGIEKGIEQGMQKQAVATAKKLLKDKKYTVEEISALLNIPVEAFVQTVEV